MRFDSLYFLIFFVVVFALSRIRTIGPLIYIIASLLFYVVAGWKDFVLIISVIVINYSASFIIKKRLMLPFVIVLNLSILLFFKYRIFLGGNFATQEIFSSDIIIPLGISFYIFQMIAYQVDIVRGHCNRIKSFPKFFLFVGFFPQLVAGPIVRASQLHKQLQRFFKQGPRQNIIYSLGIGLCLLGLIKKVILSDSIAPLVDESFTTMPETILAAWQGILLFSFQIYYDFSGYSDIALGLAYLLGIRLPINFLQPYLAKSPQEFWQRWHITLSTWIRDYLYIPLGGSRMGGWLRQFGVLIFVMAIMGLWHGANWTFLYWGAGWGAAILLWRYAGRILNKIPFISWLLTMIIAVILWVFFRAPDTAFALKYLQTMFIGSGGGGSIFVWTGLLILSLLHFGEGKIYNLRGVQWMKKTNNYFYYGLYSGLCVLILIIPKLLDNPFIYFRF